MYLSSVQVLFNFPNGLAFETAMDAVPRIGEMVSLVRVNESIFQDSADYQKYKEYEYANFSWEVEQVIWSPVASTYSYVNIILKRKVEISRTLLS